MVKPRPAASLLRNSGARSTAYRSLGDELEMADASVRVAMVLD
jgi:hypothetical protein